MLAIPMVPLQIVLPWVISKYTSGPRPLDIWVKVSSSFWIGLGVTFKIFTARLGLSVRISQIHFLKKITYINLSLFIARSLSLSF